MLITKTVKIKWNKKNKEHYVSLGYEFTKTGDKFEVMVEDLTKGCNVIISYKCDDCGVVKECMYKDYVKIKKIDGHNYCDKCRYNHRNNSKIKTYKKTKNRSSKKIKKSFYDWCIDHNRLDVLDRWDYELNECSPKDVSYSANKKCWFKCDKHSEHKSELKHIASFTRGHEGSISCNQCNSFAQWCMDNNRQDVLDRWDYKLNGCSPWDISYANGKKYWFKCNKHKEHKSGLKNISSFIRGHEGSITCNQCNSIAQWFIDNNLDINDYWDFEKNTINPWDISYGSNKKVWFKCTIKKYHGTYETTCCNFIINGSRCPYCSSTNIHPKDSLGQYIIDNYGKEFLWSVWSDKNKKSPFEYALNSDYKVYWKCLDKNHEDYLRNCVNSVKYEFRCPKCVEEMNNSIIEEKTKFYLEELGYKVLNEHKCTIRPINPKTKNPLPYDNEIILENGKHLIIEVNGEQHYKHNFHMNRHKCTKEEAIKMLHYQQLKDRYKRMYAKHMGYEYLEIPYTKFMGKNKEQYKQIIDDKIRNILKNDK